MRLETDVPAPGARSGPGTRSWWGARPVRSARAFDVAVALVLFLAIVFVEPGANGDLVPRGLGDVPIGEVALGAVACVALYWRRSRPLPVLAATIGTAVLAFAVGGSDLIGLAVFVALYSVGRYVADDRWSGAGLAIVLAMVVGTTLADPETTLPELGFGIILTAVVWYAGRRLRARDEDAERRDREHAAEARRVIVEERTRIARELHDVVAHRVSLMTVQAGAAKTVAAVDPDGAVRAMQEVEQAGRQALDELRHLLGVLRPDADGGALDPQPGLDDIDGLVDRFRTAGLEVALTVHGVPGTLPARVQLSAYRIVQEALTNALKHAGPGARTRIRIDHREDGVDITVVDDGRGGGGVPGSGHGIIGMRERAQLLGGHLEAAPRAGGGFQVIAHLPGRQETA